MGTRTKDITKKRIGIFLSIVLGILYICWMIAIIIPSLGEKDNRLYVPDELHCVCVDNMSSIHYVVLSIF